VRKALQGGEDFITVLQTRRAKIPAFDASIRFFLKFRFGLYDNMMTSVHNWRRWLCPAERVAGLKKKSKQQQTGVDGSPSSEIMHT
jgi:hypothetical protein